MLPSSACRANGASEGADQGAKAGAAYGATITFPSDRCTHQMHEGGLSNECGEPEIPIIPPACQPPVGCPRGSVSKDCQAVTTVCACTNMPDTIMFDDGKGNRFCAPRRTCWEVPRNGMPNSLGPNNPACKTWKIVPAAAIDPNDKVGTTGEGSQGYVPAGVPISYGIHFENLATATGPAAEVVITDQLDPSVVDLSTFVLGPITFGAYKFVPEAHAKAFRGGTDLWPRQSLQVLVDAALDRTTGLVTWRFSTIDPTSGQATDDPASGFLPPNTTPPDGEGAVVFTVTPKAGLPTGTVLSNRASVVFDANAPIGTPTWVNTIDRTAPTSHVLPLPASASATSFPVSWSGSDVGSGIANYTVYVADNGQPYTIWQDATTATSATYQGLSGHRYDFYSRAADLVGNVEPAKIVADATTTIGTAAACAQNVTSSVTIARSGYSYNLATRRFVQTVTLRNATANAIAGPIALALDGLPAGVALFNPAGTTACAPPAGDPFTTTTAGLPAGGTMTFSLQFDNPSRVGIGYVPRVLAGAPL
jgi:hypothetical protein